MKLLSSVKLIFENKKLEKDNDRLETLLNATEKNLIDYRNRYRDLLGERELLKEKMDLLDRSLCNTNKTLNKIIKIAESNDLNKPEIIIKKILELAKNETTSPNK